MKRPLKVIVGLAFGIGLMLAGCADKSENTIVMPASDTLFPPNLNAPYIISTIPKNNDEGVGVGTSLQANFSETLDSSSTNTSTFLLTDNTGLSVDGTTYLLDGRTFVFIPDQPLIGNITYRAIVTSGVRSFFGVAMVQNYEWYFTTSDSPDTTPPGILTVSPLNGDTNVSVHTPISALFDETVTGVTPASFVLTSASGTVTGTTVTSNTGGATGNLWSLTTGTLVSNTAYTVTLTNAIMDLATPLPFRFSPAYSWSFTTATAPQITTTTLPDATEGGTYNLALAATGGYGGLSWTMTGGSLASGLTLNTFGVLSTGTGTIGSAGTFYPEFTVTDTDGLTSAATLTLTVHAPPTIMTSQGNFDSAHASVIAGAYSFTMNASNGMAPLNWSWSGGTPPPTEFTLSSGGVISGTPTVGSVSYTIDFTVTDANGVANTSTLTLYVDP